jgi:hypothetical protein
MNYLKKSFETRALRLTAGIFNEVIFNALQNSLLLHPLLGNMT